MCALFKDAPQYVDPEAYPDYGIPFVAAKLWQEAVQTNRDLKEYLADGIFTSEEAIQTITDIELILRHLSDYEVYEQEFANLLKSSDSAFVLVHPASVGIGVTEKECEIMDFNNNHFLSFFEYPDRKQILHMRLPNGLSQEIEELIIMRTDNNLIGFDPLIGLVENRFGSSVHSVSSVRGDKDGKSQKYLLNFDNGDYITFYEHVTEDNANYFLYSIIG